MGISTTYNGPVPPTDDSAASLLNLKGSLHFRLHGANQKPHVILRRIHVSDDSDDDGCTISRVYFSLFAAKRIECKPGKEILMTIEGNPYKDSPIVFEDIDKNDDPPSNEDHQEDNDDEIQEIPAEFFHPKMKMKRAWAMAVDEPATPQGVDTQAPVRVDAATQTELCTVDTAVQTSPISEKIQRTSSLPPPPENSIPSKVESNHAIPLKHKPISRKKTPVLTQMEQPFVKLEPQEISLSFNAINGSPGLNGARHNTRSLSPMDLESPISSPIIVSKSLIPSQSDQVTVKVERVDQEILTTRTSLPETPFHHPQVNQKTLLPNGKPAEREATSSKVRNVTSNKTQTTARNPFVSGGVMTDFTSTASTSKAGHIVKEEPVEVEIFSPLTPLSTPAKSIEPATVSPKVTKLSNRIPSLKGKEKAFVPMHEKPVSPSSSGAQPAVSLTSPKYPVGDSILDLVNPPESRPVALSETVSHSSNPAYGATEVVQKTEDTGLSPLSSRSSRSLQSQTSTISKWRRLPPATVPRPPPRYAAGGVREHTDVVSTVRQEKEIQSLPGAPQNGRAQGFGRRRSPSPVVVVKREEDALLAASMLWGPRSPTKVPRQYSNVTRDGPSWQRSPHQVRVKQEPGYEPSLSYPPRMQDMPPPSHHPLPDKPSLETLSGRKHARETDFGVSPSKRRRRQSRLPSINPVYSTKLEGNEKLEIRGIVFSHAGDYIAVTCADRQVRILANANRKEIARMQHIYNVVGVEWLHNDEGIMTLTEDGRVSQWTRKTQNQWSFSEVVDAGLRRSHGQCSGWAYQSGLLAVAFPQFGVKLWRENGAGTWVGQESVRILDITTIKIIEHGFLAGKQDGTLIHYDFSRGVVRTCATFRRSITGLDLYIGYKGVDALTTTTDGIATIVDVHRGEVVATFDPDREFEQERGIRTQYAAIFAATGTCVVFSAMDGQSMVWDSNNTFPKCMLDHGMMGGDVVYAAAAHERSRSLVTGTAEGRLFWWPQGFSKIR